MMDAIFRYQNKTGWKLSCHIRKMQRIDYVKVETKIRKTKKLVSGQILEVRITIALDM